MCLQKARFVRTHKLDLLMVLLPMVAVAAPPSVSKERIAGPIVNIVIAVVFVSALFMWRVEYNATGATITTFRDAIWWAIVQQPMTW